jgi:hypothetical protein
VAVTSDLYYLDISVDDGKYTITNVPHVKRKNGDWIRSVFTEVCLSSLYVYMKQNDITEIEFPGEYRE